MLVCLEVAISSVLGLVQTKLGTTIDETRTAACFALLGIVCIIVKPSARLLVVQLLLAALEGHVLAG